MGAGHDWYSCNYRLCPIGRVIGNWEFHFSGNGVYQALGRPRQPCAARASLLSQFVAISFI
jgi:hypothetical protein